MAEPSRIAPTMDPREGSSISNTTTKTLHVIRDRADAVYFMTQLAAIFIVVCFSLYNLSTQSNDKSLWTAVLTGSLGFLLPNPKLNKHTLRVEQVEPNNYG